MTECLWSSDISEKLLVIERSFAERLLVIPGVCPSAKGDPVIKAAKCAPGCNSSMPSLAEISDPGYSWWDLYNVSNYYHSLGHDVFILSMPLKGTAGNIFCSFSGQFLLIFWSFCSISALP